MSHPVFLSQLTLNPRHPGTARLLGNPHYLHGAVTEAVGVSRVGAPRWLYHLDHGPSRTQLILQAPVVPDWRHLSRDVAPEERSTEATAYVERINTGDVLNFALAAAPRRRERDTRYETSLTNDEDRLAWLERALEPGAEIQFARVQRLTEISARNPKIIQMTSVEFIGTLKVTRPIPFRSLVLEGVGPGKAYGQGLLRTERPGGGRRTR